MHARAKKCAGRAAETTLPAHEVIPVLRTRATTPKWDAAGADEFLGVPFTYPVAAFRESPVVRFFAGEALVVGKVF